MNAVSNDLKEESLVMTPTLVGDCVWKCERQVQGRAREDEQWGLTWGFEEVVLQFFKSSEFNNYLRIWDCQIGFAERKRWILR